jgi:hypothetical protein
MTTGKFVPNLGLIWENGINTRLLLKKQSERIIEIVFSNYMDKKEAEFVIVDEGLEITKIF